MLLRAAAAFCLTQPTTAILKERNGHEWKTEGQREKSVRDGQIWSEKDERCEEEMEISLSHSLLPAVETN